MSVSQLGSFRAKSWSAGYCADIKANFCLPCSLVKSYQARFSPSCALCSQLHLCKVVVNCCCLWTGKSFISPCALSTRLQKAACSADSDPLFLWSEELYLITKAHRKMCENSKNVGQVSERLNPQKCWRQDSSRLLDCYWALQRYSADSVCWQVAWAVRLCKELNSCSYKTWMYLSTFHRTVEF